MVQYKDCVCHTALLIIEGVITFFLWCALWLKLRRNYGLAKIFDENLAFFHQKIHHYRRGTTLVEM